MAKNYEQVLKRIDALKAEAEKLRRKELGDVIDRIRDAIDHYGLTAADLGLAAAAAPRRAAGPVAAPARKRASQRKGTKVAPKYRDETGRTWTGRGLKPVWLREALAAGKTLQDFEIK